SADPDSALYIYNPANGQKQTIALTRPPTSLGLAPDGLYAVVGHDALVTLVDLKAAKVLKTYDVSMHVDDVEMSLNGWFYAVSNSTTKISGVNVKTGEVVDTEGPFYLYDGRFVMYPDGKRMYYLQ